MGVRGRGLRVGEYLGFECHHGSRVYPSLFTQLRQFTHPTSEGRLKRLTLLWFIII